MRVTDFLISVTLKVENIQFFQYHWVKALNVVFVTTKNEMARLSNIKTTVLGLKEDAKKV